jgi:hypothetical protein
MGNRDRAVVFPPRRLVTLLFVAAARRLMPLLVWLAGERCWRCGQKITPTKRLTTHHIVEARIWAWNEVICDDCIRKGLGRANH